ncbi:DsbA-like protein [Ostertagia ostertagi]
MAVRVPLENLLGKQRGYPLCICCSTENGLALQGLMRYRQIWPIDVRLRPFYLAGVIKATRNPGAPLMLTHKQAYMATDIRRNAEYWDIPISLPQDFKTLVLSKTSALAQRLLLAVQKQHPPSVLEDCARMLWRRFFTEHRSIFDVDDLRQALKDLPVDDEDALLQLAVTDEVKGTLRCNTNEALAYGCFGAPWIHVQRSEGEVEAFFGSDRLPLIGHLIGCQYQGPLTQYAFPVKSRTST